MVVAVQTVPVLKFRGVSIWGTVLRGVQIDSPGTQLYRQHFSGVEGVSEIRGGSGGRMLKFPMVLHHVYRTRELLWDFVNKTLNDSMHQRHGTLVWKDAANNFTHEFQRCTFEGFEESPDGPLYDAAETLDGGWFTTGLLTWYQLQNR